MAHKNLEINDLVREKAKFMIMASPFGEFISAATTLEIAKQFAVIDGVRQNRKLRAVAGELLKSCTLDELRRLLIDLSSSSNTEKAYNAILSYRDAFIQSAENRVASMNLFLGGDLDDLVAKGVPVEELKQKIKEFRQQTYSKVA